MPDWILFYGKMIKTSLLLSNLFPYAGRLKILFQRGCCCCVRKSYKPDLQNNPVFPRERRYASVIQTVFIAFTYGAVLPMLFWFAAVILIIQYFLDKLLITYFYKQEVQYNDFLNRNMLRVCKYALVPFFLFGGLALHNNFCSIEREPDHLKYTNQQILCQRMWIQPKVMIVTAPLLFALFVVLDVMMVWYEMED